MKLISCHINGFGKLVDFDYKFESGVNIFLTENGGGKTTFASFIKAMFYGLPSGRSADNDRKKYMPWSAKSFGGFVVYEDKEKKYRLERSFASKESEDEIALFDLDSNTKIPAPECPGEQIFDIDANTFERSLLLIGAPYKKSTHTVAENDRIIARLNGIINNEDDVTKLSSAIERLDNERRKYALIRGKGGLIYQKETERDRIEMKLAGLESKEAEIEKANADISSLGLQIDTEDRKRENLNNELKSAFKEKEIEQKLIVYKKAESEYNERKSEYEKILHLFANDPPGDDDLEEIRRLNGKLDFFARYEKNLLFSDEKKARIEELQEKQFDINQIRQLELHENELVVLKRERERLLSDSEYVELSEKQTIIEQKAENRNNQIIPIVLAILGAVSVVIGAVMISILAAIGIAAISVGILFLFAASFIYLRSYVKSIENKTNENDIRTKYNAKLEKINENQSKINELDTKISNIISMYGCKSTEELKNNVNEFKSLLADKEETDRQISEINKQRQVIFEKLDKYLSVCPDLTGDYPEKIAVLTERIKKLQTAKVLLDSANKHFIEAKENVPTDSGSVKDITRPIEDIENEIRTAEKAIKQLSQNKALLEADRLATESECDEIPRLKEKKAMLEDEINRGNRNLYAINEAMKLLKSGSDNLKIRYLPKMQEAFDGYFNMFETCIRNMCFVGKNLDISAEQAGKLRAISSYSSGLRDIMEFCIRLSLIEALFTDKTVFVIMDDPFVNLDDVNTSLALSVLEKISAKIQIVYMTCSKSRIPEKV